MISEVEMVTFSLENIKIIIFICVQGGMKAEDSKTCLWLYKDFYTPKGQVDKKYEYPATQNFYFQGSVI